MNVYAQPTTQNERLCSLLSAVLNRSITPQFTQAICQKPRALLLAKGTFAQNKSKLRVVLVGENLGQLAILVKDFALLHVLEVTTMTNEDDLEMQ
jgi:hypothetical protein